MQWAIYTLAFFILFHISEHVRVTPYIDFVIHLTYVFENHCYWDNQVTRDYGRKKEKQK